MSSAGQSAASGAGPRYCEPVTRLKKAGREPLRVQGARRAHWSVTCARSNIQRCIPRGLGQQRRRRPARTLRQARPRLRCGAQAPGARARARPASTPQERPDDSPRISSRSSITSSDTSKKSMKTQGGSSRSKALRLSSERGKPSIKKGPLPFAMAAWSSLTVVEDATIFPSAITLAMASPASEPDATSARRRSPAERCVASKRSISRAHCVPLPEPGPPMIK
eukprot:scaffold286628_cov32-Tisochrysis_lutea.AAC.1